MDVYEDDVIDMARSMMLYHVSHILVVVKKKKWDQLIHKLHRHSDTLLNLAGIFRIPSTHFF